MPPKKKLQYANTNKTDRYIRTERKESDYQDHTHHSHIFAAPDTYIGSSSKEKRDEYILDLENLKIVPQKIELPEGILRLVLEALSNVSDNADSSRRFGTNPGDIKMFMDSKTLTIRSGGEPMPITVKHNKSTKDKIVTLVDHVFGTLLTSSNYDPNVIRMGNGKNGYGIKLVNIFSTKFKVKVGNNKLGQEHVSIWENNMQDLIKSKTTPGFILSKTTPCEFVQKNEETGEDETIVQKWSWIPNPNGEPYRGENYVEVSWDLDFERFGYQEYPEEAFGLFARYLIDFGFTCKLPVSFNGQNFDTRDIKNYAKLFFNEDECKNSITHYQWNNPTNQLPESLENLTPKERAKKIAKCESVDVIPVIELCIFDTPDNARCYSYVNGLMTIEGGVHVTEAYDAIFHQILEKINNPGKKNKKNVKSSEKKIKLTMRDLKPHVSMIINCRLPDTQYDSQSKKKLTSPKPRITISEQTINSISKWSLIERLEAELDAKKFKQLTKGDSKKKGKFFLDKGENANEAGTKTSSECTIYFTEGDSASAYAKKRIDKLPGGRDKNGYLPLGGKVLNVANVKIEKILENKVLKIIRGVLNLKEGVDYSLEENIKTLNYGHIISNVDADSDGSHINALLLNFFHQRFPAILERGMFGYLMVPVIKIIKKDKVLHRFYSTQEFDQWLEENPNHGFDPTKDFKYYKGLATSTDDDIEDDLKTAATIICVYDDDAEETIDLNFNKKRANDRKRNINNLRNKTRINDIQVISRKDLLSSRYISNILNTDLIDYDLDTFFRAIPGMKDGLKKSQRQALYYILDRWNYGKSDKKEAKVADIASGAKELTQYHHGNASLEETIKGMAQDFIGSNNMNFFAQYGQFGTRGQLGEDCGSSRYILSKHEWWIKYAYSKELISLVEKHNVDGQEAEPIWIPCDLPMHIVNGIKGVATGYSTFIPPHNPLHIIDWIFSKFDGNAPTKLIPWFKDFKGEVSVYNRYKIQKDEENEEEPEEEQNPDSLENVYSALSKNGKGLSLKTEGTFEEIRSNDTTIDLVITEIPIGISTEKYYKFIEKLVLEKKAKECKNNSIHETKGKNPKKGEIKITVKGLVKETQKGTEISIKKQLKLTKSFGLTNMYLIDDKGFPIYFNNVEEVMEVYYKNMIKIYKKLIKNKIEVATDELNKLEYHFKLISLINNGSIQIVNVTKKMLSEQMEKYNIPIEYIKNIKAWDTTSECIDETSNKIEKQKELIEEIKLTKPEELWREKLVVLKNLLERKGF